MAQAAIVRPQPYAPTSAQARWWKGQPHLHSLWSTGEAPPEEVGEEHSEGDAFLAFTETNTVLAGEHWVPLARVSAGSTTLDDVRGYREGREARLPTLAELRARFEGPGAPVLLDGQELANGTGLHPVDVVVLGARGSIEPRYGVTPRERAEQSAAAVQAQALAQPGEPLFAFLAHPLWGETFSAAELAALRGIECIEVVSREEESGWLGDETHPGAIELWDRANVERAQRGAPLLLGIAGEGRCVGEFQYTGDIGCADPAPWIAVRTEALRQPDLIRALQDGDFYFSTGIVLDDVRFDGRTLTVDVHEERDDLVPLCSLPAGPTAVRPSEPIESHEHVADHSTRFVGARCGQIESGVTVLFATDEDPARYTLAGDELFVRAEVTSDSWVYGSAAACAWTQPVQPAAR